MKKTSTLNKGHSKEQVKDPTCGMDVDKTSAFHTERDGKTFYFCGNKCQQDFISAASNKKHKN